MNGIRTFQGLVASTSSACPYMQTSPSDEHSPGGTTPRLSAVRNEWGLHGPERGI